MTEQPDPRPRGTSRREFLTTAGTAGLVAAINGGGLMAQETPGGAAGAPGEVSINLKINGKDQRVQVDPRTTLLDCLRERAGLTGTKKGCDHGQCGACTVMVEGRRINSCLTLAVMHDGAKVTTIEGLGQPGNLHPMQAAFIKHDGYQCGYCTPGQICSAVGMLGEMAQGIPSHATADLNAAPPMTTVEFRERMSGNICRCGAYSNIAEAISEVAGVKA